MASSQEDSLHRVILSARNLMPTAFYIAADPDNDIKKRWTAFDKVFDFVEGEMLARHTPLSPANFDRKDLSEQLAEQIAARSLRYKVAVALLVAAYPDALARYGDIMIQADELVPRLPDPDTMRPPLTGKDQVILFELTALLRTEMPDDWDCFFKATSEPVERRREAFKRIYYCVAGTWRENSDFARSMQPEHCQAMILLALMSHVPQDQWTTKDLEDLRAELLPVDEPDWDELSLLADEH